jgi:hypothetical protein
MQNKKALLYYGLQRSGTNYLHELLTNNFKVSILNSDDDRAKPVQKHFRLYDDKNLVPEPRYQNHIIISSFQQFLDELNINEKIDGIIVISKDPYSWYLSYCKWAKICSWEKVDHHYIEEYNLFYAKWMALSKETDCIQFIRYIDLLTDKNNILAQLKSKFQLESNWSLKSIKSKILNTKFVPQSDEFTKSKNNYYVNQEYLQKFRTDEIHTINAKLDDDLMTFLGYTKHQPQ